MVHYQIYSSPIGKLYLVSEGEALLALLFASHWKEYSQKFDSLKLATSPVLEQTKAELSEYFAGKREEFSIPLDLRGTDFQVTVWRSLAKIPYGKTVTYGQQANKIKNPKAVRAVGRANGQNPISIILPCHRVIGASGKLVGYGGGLEQKDFLLRHEGCLL